ncbi:MAG: metalloregulator ArsR/SmtB family transcription factor [Spirochaetaceae bacterium]|nr:metalloregulator ArsR/SmtB family transcription factor [Myxococcales bacterium]MCB9722824.1 metalloregulator ArsR/SmtB family transcription factor [Spirochaetaceae bacterium]HPG24986.1 metalloregulator ArsR/SmtB family transcription factor [Myxococcota bacterium]
MTTPAGEALQKVFKTLADPTRLRILRLLEQEELIVGELMTILGMAQSRVSRHLAILREAGLLADRREGTFVAYRLVLPDSGPWREAWALARGGLAGDPTAERDDAMLRRTLAAREARTGRSFFDAVGPEWDALRRVFGDDLLRARAMSALVPEGLEVADIGTGTGVLALELARLGLDVVGLDRSEAMLEGARRNWEAMRREASGRLELRIGDAHALPLDDASVDAAFAHMVLHSLAEPERAIAEMARIVRPGGRVVLVDFLPHEHAWMQSELGLLWLGFPRETVEDWLAAAGLQTLRFDEQEPEPDAKRDLPASFVAVARRPPARDA